MLPSGVTFWQGVGLFIGGYLLLLARSAWKQGELGQFLRSLAVVAALGVAVYGMVLGYDLLLNQ